MDYAVGVGVRHPVGQRGQQGGGLGERDRPAAEYEFLGERGAGTVGGTDERDRPDLAGLEDRHQVGVVEGGRRPRLAEEALPRLRRQQRLRAGQLEGDLPVERGVEGQEHDAEPAPAEFADESEPPQPLPGRPVTAAGHQVRVRLAARAQAVQSLQAGPVALPAGVEGGVAHPGRVR